MLLTITAGKFRLAAYVVAALAAAVPVPFVTEAAATPLPLFTNLGPGQSFDSGLFQYVQIVGGNPANILSIGTKFTATASGNLAQVLLPVADSLGVASFFLSSATGVGNTGLGSILESWINVSVPTSPTSLSLLTLASVADPLLASGTTYWFFEVSANTGTVLCTPDGVTCPSSGVSPSKGVFWRNALLGTGGFFEGNPTLMNTPQEFAASAVPPAIELDTNVSPPSNSVPEPASVLLLAGSLLGLGFVMQRKRAA
jgi:hypothetical protein